MKLLRVIENTVCVLVFAAAVLMMGKIVVDHIVYSPSKPQGYRPLSEYEKQVHLDIMRRNVAAEEDRLLKKHTAVAENTP